ncbi:metal-dependent phosphohydrolase, partial [Streptomyces sp. 15-116A]|nr:metal-dependent phosphohydrolase [Streptomyces sp. 15-116A]
MEALPARARVCVAGVALVALLCLLPLPIPAEPGRWWPAAALLAALYAGCERLARSRHFGTAYPGGTFYPVLLAGAFLLPPHAAALVALPGALLAPV